MVVVWLRVRSDGLPSLKVANRAESHKQKTYAIEPPDEVWWAREGVRILYSLGYAGNAGWDGS